MFRMIVYFCEPVYHFKEIQVGLHVRIAQIAHSFQEQGFSHVQLSMFCFTR